MSASAQLLVLVVNFLFGVFFNYLSLLNYHVIRDETILVKLIILILFVLDATLVYLLVIYRINYGYFHIYYLITFTLGFASANYLKKLAKKMSTKIKSVDSKKVK